MDDLAHGGADEQSRHYAAVRSRLWGEAPKRAPMPVPRARPKRKRPIVARGRVPVVLIGIPSGRLIIRLVALGSGVGMRKLMGKARSDRVSQARHLAFWLLKTHCRLGPTAIGRLMRRDHHTVIYGIAQHEARRRGELLTVRVRGSLRSAPYMRATP